MSGLAWQSSSVAQAIVQMAGLVMIVRGSGETAKQENVSRQSASAVQGSAKLDG
jgi:hypothetical protein